MATAEEMLKYYFACSHVYILMSLHCFDRIEALIPEDQGSLADATGFWMLEERSEIERQEKFARRKSFEQEMDDNFFKYKDSLFRAAHKLSDEMCWISEDNFLYFIFCQFVRGALITFEQLASGISPYYTDEDKPDFASFIEFLEKKTPSDSGARVRVDVLAQELTEMWRQEIDKAVAEYRFEED